METQDQPKSDPELVQISIEGELCYAFKWNDETSAWRREVNYVFRNARDRKILCLLINCAPRIPVGTSLVSLRFHSAEKFCESADFSSAETTWDNGSGDNESDVRICPTETFKDRRLRADLQHMILEHRDGKRELRQIGKKEMTLDDIHAVHADVRDLKIIMSPLPAAVDNLGKGVATMLQHARGIPKVLDDLEESQTVPENATREILAKIHDVLTLEEQRIWTAVRNSGTQKDALEELRESGIVISESKICRLMKVINAKLFKSGLSPRKASGPATRYKKTGGYTNDEGKTVPVEFSPVEKDWANDPSDRDATIQSYLAARSKEDKTHFRQIYPGIEDEAESYQKRHPMKSR